MNEIICPVNNTQQSSDVKTDQGLVIIVDDNPENLRTLTSVLEAHGYETRAAINGELALEAIKTVHPDLIMLDIMMPGINDYKVCRQLKANANTSNIPVLFISAMSDTMDKVKAFEVGGIDYIPKPFQAQEVLARTRTHIALALARRQLEESNSQLQQRTSKLEALNKELSSFAYSVSHDLRAPLRTIDGFSHTMLEDYYDLVDDNGKDYLQRIRSGVQKMGQLIDDMLKLSRVTQSELSLRNIDLGIIANNIIQKMQSDAPDRAVQAEIMSNMKTKADPHLMEIALNNLLGNAWKFTAKNPHPCIKFGIKERDGRPVYFVGDNGVGFDMRYVNKLFGAFQRLHSDAEFEGTGIGLATVARVIQLHGGHVWAESILNKGATFYFTLS